MCVVIVSKNLKVLFKTILPIKKIKLYVYNCEKSDKILKKKQFSSNSFH